MSPASSGLPNNSASPSLGGSRPVSIFMVVVLPEPFEPTKPKISPRSMVKLTRSTAVKSPKRQVSSRAVMTGSASAKWRGGICEPVVTGALLLGQQRHEGFFHGPRAVWVLSSAGEPLARILPPSMAISKSNRSASSM